MSMMTSNPINLGLNTGVSPTDDSQTSQPLFNQKELEDLERFSSLIVWDSLKKNPRQNEFLKGLGNFEKPDEINGDSRQYFKRFQSVDAQDETQLSKMAQEAGLGDSGMLSYSPFSGGQWRQGTLGFHEASVVGNYLGSILELGSTNQNTTWAQTMMFLDTGLLEDSPAAEPILRDVPLFKTQKLPVPTGGNLMVEKDVYIKPDGSPLTASDLQNSGIDYDPSLITDPSQLITPDTVLQAGPEGVGIPASQLMPMTTELVSPGLGQLMRNEFEESLYNYNKDTVNNFERFWRIGDYGPATRYVSTLPVLDVIEAYVTIDDPVTTNPAWVALNRSNKINGAELVKTLKERDPNLVAAWTQEGVNWEVLEQATTAGEFRAHVNGVFVNNAIARSVTTSWKRDPYYSYLLSAREMAYGTLVSGDAVGQALIMAATAGIGTAVSAGLTVRGALAANRGATLSRAAIRVNLNSARRVRSILQNVVKTLPVNLPSTFLDLAATRLGTTLPRVAKLAQDAKKAGKGWKGTLWVLGQGVEGFIEEGVTDLLNQGYEYSLGMRSNLDLGQTWTQAWTGFLAEPILGAALAPVNLTTAFVVNSPNLVVGHGARLLGLNSTRAREFNTYLSAFNGNWDNLNYVEQEIRMERIARGLVFEATFGRHADGKFRKIEDAEQTLSAIGAELSTLGSTATPTTVLEAGIALGEKLRDLNEKIEKDSLPEEVKIKLVEAINAGVLSVDSDQTLRLNEDIAEVLLGFIALGAQSSTKPTLKQAFIQEQVRKVILDRVRAENPELIKQIEQETDEKLKEELEKDLEAKVEEAKEIPDVSIAETLEKNLNLFLSLIPGTQEIITTETLSEETKKVFEDAQRELDEELQVRIDRLVQEHNLAIQLTSDFEVQEQPATPITVSGAAIGTQRRRTDTESVTAPTETALTPDITQTETTPEATGDQQTPPTSEAEPDQQVIPTPEATVTEKSELQTKVEEVLKTLGIDSAAYLQSLAQVQPNIDQALRDILDLSAQAPEGQLRTYLKSFISC